MAIDLEYMKVSEKHHGRTLKSLLMSWWMDLWHSTCHQTMAVSKVYSNVET
jgi:hypothetical protein